jgi:hypothetical protein
MQNKDLKIMNISAKGGLFGEQQAGGEKTKGESDEEGQI